MTFKAKILFRVNVGYQKNGTERIGNKWENFARPNMDGPQKKKRKWGQSQQFLTILLSDFSGEKVHVLSHVPVQS